jgi:hypothetical protein
MDRWIDTDTIDQCYRSIQLVMLTTNSIDPSVKDFFFLIDSIDHHKILVKLMTIDPLVHFQPMVSIHRSEIDSPITIFLNERDHSKSILQQ